MFNKAMASVCLFMSIVACKKEVSTIHIPQPFHLQYDTTVYGSEWDVRQITFPQFNDQTVQLDSANLLFDVKVKAQYKLTNPGDMYDGSDSLFILRVDHFDLFGESYQPVDLSFFAMADLMPMQQKFFNPSTEAKYNYKLNDSLCTGNGLISMRYYPGSFLEITNEVLPYDLDINSVYADTVKISLVYSGMK